LVVPGTVWKRWNKVIGTLVHDTEDVVVVDLPRLGVAAFVHCLHMVNNGILRIDECIVLEYPLLILVSSFEPRIEVFP